MLLRFLEGRLMDLGQHPHFERKTRSERGNDDESFVLCDNARGALHFLPDDVAEYAAFLEIVIPP